MTYSFSYLLNNTKQLGLHSKSFVHGAMTNKIDKNLNLGQIWNFNDDICKTKQKYSTLVISLVNNLKSFVYKG